MCCSVLASLFIITTKLLINKSKNSKTDWLKQLSSKCLFLFCYDFWLIKWPSYFSLNCKRHLGV